MSKIEASGCAQKGKRGRGIGVGILVLLVVLLLVNGANAVSFSSFTGTTGAIGVGNGYFNDENSVFGLASSRNIYVTTELTQINIVEPLSYALRTSTNYTLVTKGDSNLRYAMVASDGYLYFVDSTGIKRKTVRSSTTPIVANNSDAMILLYTSANVYKLQELSNEIYFIDGTSLKKFDLALFTIVTVYASGISAYHGVSEVFIKDGVVTVIYIYNYYVGGLCANWDRYQFVYAYYNGTKYNLQGLGGYVSWNPANPGGLQVSVGFLSTANYIYSTEKVNSLCAPYAHTSDWLFLKSNYSYTIPSYFTLPQTTNNGIALGKYSTIAMYSLSTGISYDVFSFVEADFTPDPATMISGYVTNSSGSPVAGAHIQLSNSTWTDPCVDYGSCTSDAAGYWYTSIYANDYYNYSVSKAQYITVSGNQYFYV